jgi:hypothetical protein
MVLKTNPSRDFERFTNFRRPWIRTKIVFAMASLCLYVRLAGTSSQSYVTTDGLSVSSPHLGPKTKFMLLPDSCGFVVVGRSLWREDGSVIYNFSWPSPALARVLSLEVDFIYVLYLRVYPLQVCCAVYLHGHMLHLSLILGTPISRYDGINKGMERRGLWIISSSVTNRIFRIWQAGNRKYLSNLT